MKRISIFKHNLMRAAMTLALMVTCATAWATDVQTYYIDENGTSYNVTATVLTGSETSIGTAGETTWYVVNSDITYNGKISYLGNPSLILADGKTMTVINNGDEPAIQCLNSTKLTIYGQTLGSGSLVASSASGKAAIQTPGNIEIYGGHVSATGRIGIEVQYIYIKGGSVSATGTLQGITAWRFYVYGGQVTAMGGEGYKGIQSSNNITIGWRRTSDFITWNGYSSDLGTVHIMDDKTFYAGATAYHDDGSGSGVSIPDGTVTLRPYSSDDLSVNEAGTEYTIHTAAGWGYFCDAIDGGESFSGKTVKLDANISVTRMAGIYNATTNNGHAFSGAFNGQNNTLTFNCTAANDYVAPFAYLSGTSAAHASISDLNVVTNITATDHRHIAGLVALHKGNVDVTNCHAVVNLNATVGNTNPSDLYPAGLVSQTDSSGRLTISNCTTTGTITTDGKYAAGLVGVVQGTDTIEDCVSSVTINSSTAGDGTHGGLVAVTQTNSTTTIEGCLFNGKLLTANTGETATGNCGGILGWKNATVTIKNTLYAPAELNDGEHEVVAGTGVHPSGTFYRGNAPTLTNCYYTRVLNTVQGTQAHSITAGENVTVANAGTLVKVYNTSGITIYGTGIKYNDVLYASNGDAVSLTLTNTPPQGSLFMGYTVSPEGTTLNGNNPYYTLTMPDENVTIGAMMKGPVTYLDENGVQQTKQPSEYTILTNTMTTLGTADQETWYVADGTLNFNHTINVNGVVHLILKDNAVMNVGTEQNPISDSGISAEGPSISIYGQSTGSDIGMLSVYATYCGIYDYDYYENNNNPNYDYAVTINGGNIFVSASSYGIQSNKVTINGGQVWATASISGIASYPNAITLGWTSPYDFIFANNYQGDVIVKEGKTFTDGNGNVFSGTVAPASINGKTLYPAVAVTLNDGITAGSGIITAGENHYAKVGQTVTFGVTVPSGYAVSGITVTPTVTVTNNGNGTYSFTTPAADVTVSATFALQPVSVNYLDENGVQHTVDALPLLGGGATTLAAGWYVVNSDISYTGTVTLVGSGDVKLILADDHTMNVGTSENRIEYGIKTYNNDQTLTIYGQSTGNHMGILSIYTSHYCIYPLALTINGGHVIANADGNYATALRTTYQTITINGGTVEATATGTGAYAIHSGDNFTYAGGTLITNAASVNAIKAYHGRYTFTWRNPNDSITIGSTGLYAPDDTYTATFTKAFTDGMNIYSGTLRGSQLNALAGKTLYPVTAYKTIAAHSTTEQPVSGWYLIASPVGDVSATAVNNLANTNDNDGFDLYRFNQAADAEWENWKSQECEGNHYHFDLESGRGYLYANAANVNLIFTGTPYSGPCEITLTKATDAGIDFSGWNLVGNPFNETAYIDKTDFYRMNAEGSEIVAATDNAIAPMEGIFVLADENGETLTFIPEGSSKGHIQKPEPEQVVLNLSHVSAPEPVEGAGVSTGSTTAVIDRAIVRMGEGGTLPKFQIRENSTKIYIPQGGKDYAIVSLGNVSEIPVNFRANENGQYTISVNPEGVEMSYLHLIDNMTGADVDLLAAKVPELVEGPTSNNGVSTGSTTSYTFNAKTTDYESRFKLVFVANDTSTGSASDETFAFMNNGNWIIANDGDATLQVIDLNGRILSSQRINGSVSKSIHAAAGVYMLRLINGDEVKTQKIVVR